jgi:hypothetical protein
MYGQERDAFAQAPKSEREGVFVMSIISFSSPVPSLMKRMKEYPDAPDFLLLLLLLLLPRPCVSAKR